MTYQDFLYRVVDSDLSNHDPRGKWALLAREEGIRDFGEDMGILEEPHLGKYLAMTHKVHIDVDGEVKPALRVTFVCQMDNRAPLYTPGEVMGHMCFHPGSAGMYLNESEVPA